MKDKNLVDKRDPKNAAEPKGRRQIMPVLWLKGMQGLISNALGFRTSRNRRGIQHVKYFEGIHTEKQVNEVKRRRAKNKVARRSRRINRIRAKH